MTSSELVPLISGGLASSQSVDGCRDADAQAVIQVERLLFRSLDEDQLMQAQLEERRRQLETDRWIGRAFGAGLALLFGGFSDGFDLGDLTGGFMGGVVGGLAADGLNHLSERELSELGLDWANQPASFTYHRRRHGQPRQRVLVMFPNTPGQAWVTAHGVRFGDGYIAFFSPAPLSSDAPLLNGVRQLNGNGLVPDPDQPPLVLGHWPCSDGRQRAMELLPCDQGNLLVLAVPIPHHSLY